MSRSSCEWVHRRLPLLVGDGEGVSNEGCDLAIADREQVQHHLADCASCRKLRAELEETIRILGLASEQLATSPASTSVWALLEDRIQRHQETQSRSQWHQVARAICPRLVRNTLDRIDHSWGHLLGELPLRSAWARDSLIDWIIEFSLYVRVRRAIALRTFFQPGIPRLGFGLGVIMVLLTVFLTVACADRQRFLAELQISANTSPISEVEPFQARSRREIGHVVTLTAPDVDSRVSNSLAQSDPIPVAEVPVPGPGASVKSVGTATAAATAAPTSSPRLDFDLEHGTPMPSQTRTGNLTY